MGAFFAEYGRYIVFIHVFFAIVWVGGMIAIRFSMHPALQAIEDVSLRQNVTLRALDRFFLSVSAATVFVGLTGIVMMIALGFKSSPDLYLVVHIKTQIWMVMAIVYGVVYYRFTKAKKAFLSEDYVLCAKYMAPLSKALIPMNIFLGVVAVMLGVILRGY